MTPPRTPLMHAEPDGPAALDARQARFAHQIGARLSEVADFPSRDVVERLRASREQALAVFRDRRGAVIIRQGDGAGVLADRFGRWRTVLGSALPVLALLGGLWGMDHLIDDSADVAEIDLAILKDPLPPAAYADSGFLEFLKSTQDD